MLVLEIAAGVVLANIVNAAIAGVVLRRRAKKRGAALQEQFQKLLAEVPEDESGEPGPSPTGNYL